MSLAPQPITSIPEETVRVAQAAFPNSTRFMQMRDQLGPIYDDATFADLYPRRGQPAETPWRLALITVMQDADNLTDRQATDAVRSRIDFPFARFKPPSLDGPISSAMCRQVFRIVNIRRAYGIPIRQSYSL